MGCTTNELSTLTTSLGAEGAAIVCSKLNEATSGVAAAESVDTLFLLLCGAVIFSMHTGFAMLCAGALRVPHVNSILVHTTLDLGVTAVVFYIVGFGLGFGENEDTNAFMGDRGFALKDIKSNFGSWPMVFIQWVFCATATTITHGAVAERVHFATVLGYCIFLPLFVYPVLAHWVWTGTGWLSPLNHDPLLDSGLVDAGGCTTVHMVGAFSGLMGAWIMGPRLGRYRSSGEPVTFPGHSMPLVIFGALLLWFGWYCFNPVAILFIHSSTAARVVARSAITTTLGGAGGLLMATAIAFYQTKKIDPSALCNGLLTGCVATTAASPVVEPWAALLAGLGSPVVFELFVRLLDKLHIDDPLGAFPMHGACGIWGLVVPGLFAKEEFVIEFYGRTVGESTPHGLFYGGGAKVLACQILGAVVTVVWVSGLTGIFFMVMKYFNLLRATAEQEVEGLDIAFHDCPAYDTEKPDAGDQIKVKTALN